MVFNMKYAKCPNCNIRSEENSFQYKQEVCLCCNIPLEYFGED